VPYHPVVLAPEREEVVGCALAAVEIFTAPVVDPRLRVWLRVVQDGNGVLHRYPVRAELSGALRTGTAEQRQEWARRLEGEGWRNMVTVDAASERTRLLTLSSAYQDAEDDADPAVWGMFAVTLPVPEAGLALLRRAVAAQAARPASSSTAACSTRSTHSFGSTQ